MRAAGLGFRAGASVASLRSAISRAGGVGGLGVLATLDAKAGAPAIQQLARDLGLPVIAVRPDVLAAQRTLTHSPRVFAQVGAGSVAEAAALAAAGRNSRLTGTRAISDDGMATAAIAEAEEADEGETR